MQNSPQNLTSPGAAFSFIQAAGREERAVRGASPAAQRRPPSPAPPRSLAPTRLPDVEVGVQDVATGGRALAELLLGHGTQVLSRQLLEGLPDLWQPVLVLRPQDPLLHVAGAPVCGVWRQRVSVARDSLGKVWANSAHPTVAPGTQALLPHCSIIHQAGSTLLPACPDPQG